MDEASTLAEFLAMCEYVYLNGSSKTVESVVLFVANVKDLLVFKQNNAMNPNDVYFPEYHYQERKHH